MNWEQSHRIPLGHMLLIMLTQYHVIIPIKNELSIDKPYIIHIKTVFKLSLEGRFIYDFFIV